MTQKTIASPKSNSNELKSSSNPNRDPAIFATSDSRENLSGDYYTAQSSTRRPQKRDLAGQSSVKVFERPSPPFVAKQESIHRLKPN